jgi:hypothetical protein
MLEKNLPDFAQNFFNAIVIAIEIVIRINRTLIENFLPDFG